MMFTLLTCNPLDKADGAQIVLYTAEVATRYSITDLCPCIAVVHL